MKNLNVLIENKENRQALIKDGVALVEHRLQAARGVAGGALRGAFRVANSARPNLIRDACAWLIPDFLAALDPMFQESRSTSASFGDYLLAHQEETADRLLQVTDHRVGHIGQPIRKAYEGVRKMARKQVLKALPEFAAVVDKHVHDQAA